MKQIGHMKKKNTTKIGNQGEDLVVWQLVNDGYAIVARNYKPMIAEIDIIASKNGTIYFVEVKSVTHETLDSIKNDVPHETVRPEELIDSRKLRKIGQGSDIWLAETGFTGNYQLDVALVHMVPREKYAKITIIEGVSGE